MIGAIIGDIIGSTYENNNVKTKDFELLPVGSHPTDDSMMTLAIGKALTDSYEEASDSFDYDILKEKAVENMVSIGQLKPYSGYGPRFLKWLFSDDHDPYNSLGNGSAMRVSACGILGKTLEETQKLAEAVTIVTHNHPEGIKGGVAIASIIFLAKEGKTKDEIRKYVEDNFYTLDFTLDGIRDDYIFDMTCMNSVPQAIEAFLESDSYEDAIRNAISIGGDSDTLACIAGSIAEVYYKEIPSNFIEIPYFMLTSYENDILDDVYSLKKLREEKE